MRRLHLPCIFLVLQLLPPVLASAAVPFAVLNNNDAGPGSLRVVIAASNTTAGVQTITFADTVTNSITVNSTITISDTTVIEGRGTTIGSCGLASGVNIITISTSNAGNTMIRNLALVTCHDAIDITNASNVRIMGCAIGTDWSNSTSRGIQAAGINLSLADNTQIGSALAADRNLIGRCAQGVLAQNSRNLKIQNNYIGVGSNGSAQLANTNGLDLQSGCASALIGGNRTLGEGNIISGNTDAGINLSQAMGNTICGNIVGLSADQSTVVANNNGIRFTDAIGNWVGLPSAGYENILAGNVDGIRSDGASSGNIIQNNYIGLNSSSTMAANTYCGIEMAGGSALIGGRCQPFARERNVISGNGYAGIYLASNGNTVCGNLIGLGVDSTPVRADARGILINSSSNLIGGSMNDEGAGYGNIISGNQQGIYLNTNAGGNSIVGNWVGLKADGSTPAPNLDASGICSQAHLPNFIGAAGPGLGNVIVHGAVGYGLYLGNAYGQVVSGNRFGLSSHNDQVLSGNPILIYSNSLDCLIGGTTPGAGNIINASGVSYDIEILSGCERITLEGNWLGVLPNGVLATGQASTGIYINDASDSRVGVNAVGGGNLIAGMPTGIHLVNFSSNNAFFNNTICANAADSILLDAGTNNNKAAPMIGVAQDGFVAGTAGAGDLVQVFRAENNPAGHGGSLAYLAQATAQPNGFWNLQLTDYVSGYLCALATDSSNNTSDFSVNYLMSWLAPTLTATATPTATPQATATPTPTATSTPSNPWGSVDLTGRLVLAFPNPARDQVRFLLAPDRPVRVKIILFNLAGERVGTVEEALPAGRGTVAWDCRSVTAGVYVARVMLDGKEMAKLKVAVAK